MSSKPEQMFQLTDRTIKLQKTKYEEKHKTTNLMIAHSLKHTTSQNS
jgi:hypothetical protein